MSFVSKSKKIIGVLSRKEKLAAAGAFFLMIVSMIVLGSITLEAATKVVPARGGEYVEGIVGQPAIVNPVLAQSETDQALTRLLFANVTDLALKVEHDEEDPRVWRVRLKEGLPWHDHAKLTSDDVIFTVQKIQDPETASPLFQSWQGITASRLSELEVQFTTLAPYAFFPNNLRTLYVVPKHLFVGIPISNWRLSEYILKPVGSGPYMVSDFTKDANGFIQTYHLKSFIEQGANEPFIPNFTLRFFGTTSEALQSFNAGEVDGLGGVTPEDITSVQRPYELHAFTLPSYYALFVNSTNNSALQDKAVRSALDEAVDRNALVQAIFHNQASVVAGPLPTSFSGNSTSTPFSLENASETLTAAGWIMGDDSVRRKNTGATSTPLQIKLVVPDVPFLIATEKQIENTWVKLGVTVTLTTEQPEEVVATTIKNRDYDVLLFGNTLNGSPDLFSFWHSSERLYPGLNLSLYNNKNADTLLENIRQEFDEGRRNTELQSLADTITNNLPAFFLYNPYYLYVTSKNLKGSGEGYIPTSEDRLKNVSQWYLETTRVLK